MESMYSDSPSNGLPKMIDFNQGRALRPVHLLDLYVRPRTFFTSGIALGAPSVLLIIAFIVGMAGFVGRLEKQMAKAEYLSMHSSAAEFFSLLSGNWYYFWSAALLLGAISGVVLWFLGGWWYNLRIKWSGAKQRDSVTGRTLYIYVLFISALPKVLEMLGYTFSFENYLAAYQSEMMWPLWILIFPFWGLFTSYKAVTAMYEVKKGLAMLWFLILPFIVYSGSLIALIAAVAGVEGMS